MPYLIANWKMNLPPEGIDAYMATVGAAEPGDVTIVVCPPFPFLRTLGACGAGVCVGAQNCSDQQSGAFTGEVAPSMLRRSGADFVILGHSERRTLFHENDALIARKLSLALETGLTPVLCIGEDLRVRDSGQVSRFLADQIKVAAVDALASGEKVILAYEPIWAIGTGRNASGAMVAETLVEIRAALERFWPAAHARAPILYGGSVTPDNVDDLVEHGTIDGFLVGGASLDARKFLAIHAGLRRG
ncbi:MAG: triose-phosphate isomerase [Acidobacteria bacterium]|nr:triose-phosphate isomerase [Acidobacteriota bacterium]MBV9476438.1 triose-phosphate isomerase [Acidobacteriota bacterium]